MNVGCTSMRTLSGDIRRVRSFTRLKSYLMIVLIRVRSSKVIYTERNSLTSDIIVLRTVTADKILKEIGFMTFISISDRDAGLTQSIRNLKDNSDGKIIPVIYGHGLTIA